MRRSLVAVVVCCLAGWLDTPEGAPVRAAGPPAPASALRPPWQRYLRGEDARKAEEEEKELARLQAAGRFAEALEVAERLARRRARVQGADHWQARDARSAVEAIRQVLKAPEEDQQDYRRSLAWQRQAAALEARGRYRDAQPLREQALAIRRNALGEEHPSTAAGYYNLAANQDAQGKYAEAEGGFRRALAIRRKALGEEHPDTAASYNNLALNQDAQGKYREAEGGYRRALAIYRKALGEEHPRTALSYNNLAANQDAQGKYREAEGGLRRALAIRIKALGEEHPSTATSYNNLAVNQQSQGKYAEAEGGFRRALAIRIKALGEHHPETAAAYHNLAANQNAQGKYGEAEQLWRQAAESFGKARLHLAATGLERATKTSERSPLPSLAAVLARNGKPEDAWHSYERGLARGTWDDLTARLRRSPKDRDRQALLARRVERLRKLLEKAPSSQSARAQADPREQLLGQLRQAQDDLAAFARQLEKTYGPVAGEVFTREKVQAALPADAALVGWLDLPGSPRAADPGGEHWAVLLRRSGPPAWVRLPGSGDKGAWTEADTRLPAELRAALQSPRGDWREPARRLRQQRLQPLLPHLRGVRRLVVLPSTALAGVPVEVVAGGFTVSYAHSGSMYAHLRSLRAPATHGLLALTDPVFEPAPAADKPPPLPPGGVLLTLVLPGSAAARAGLRPNDVLLRYAGEDLAGPADLQRLRASAEKAVPVVVWREGKALQRAFTLPPCKLGVILADRPAPQAVAEQRRLDRLLASRGGEQGRWQRLPGTRFEVASLQRLFGPKESEVLLDSEASEDRLDALAASGALGKYRYVHLATHGEADGASPLRSAVILSADRLPDERRRTELLLAGRPTPDGRLTAEEMLGRWDLDCELVTLSACQTALGKYERGEGFVGFAQALVLCGSRAVCLSLWKVDDAATALLMGRFYENLLGRREGLKAPLGKASALAEAKSWLRSLPREEAAKRAAALTKGVARGKRPELPPLVVAPPAKPEAGAKTDCPYAHPYYWAAFVLVGRAD